MLYGDRLRVREWLSLTAFLGTADIRVHVVHISRVIIAYTLESLSSLTILWQHRTFMSIKLFEQTQQVWRVTRYGVPTLDNPFQLTCALTTTSESSFVLAQTQGIRSPCGHSRRLLTHYRPCEVRNSIYRYRKSLKSITLNKPLDDTELTL